MPDLQDQQVTVRLLPDGDAYAGLLCRLSGQIMRIDLAPFPGTEKLIAGGLVEITCPETLYLGEVRSRRGETMIVGVEHALDRETLELIQQVWRGPARQ